MNQYSNPQVDDLLNQLNGSKYYIKIYLMFGYHQVPIESNDVWKTTFNSKEAYFEWLVIPFGLTKAPTIFMRLMDDILRPFTNFFVVLYLEFIINFNKSWEAHLQYIQQVLPTLWQHNL